MKKRFITSIISLSILFTSGCKAALIPIEPQYTKEELTTLIAEQQDIKYHAHTMAQSARELGYPEDSEIIKEAGKCWEKADQEEKKYETKLAEIAAAEEVAKRVEEERIAAEEAEWAIKEATYPEATKVWRYMKALGWNDYVCAGIMGNMMTECGGQTLNLRPAASSGSYYGICQWGKHYPSVWGTGLDTQLDFLRDTIKYEIDTYGSKYKNGFNFNSFLTLQDARAAALAFSKCYERCGSASYSIRQDNAIKAYNYFVN